MPKGTRKTKNVSTERVFGGQAYFTDANKSDKMKAVSEDKARTVVGDKGMKELKKFPSSKRVVDSKGGSYLTPKGKKMVAAKKKMESVAKKAVKSAVKKVKGKK